jgi:hypothetical protein
MSLEFGVQFFQHHGREEAWVCPVAFGLYCSIKDSKLCYSAAKTVFFLCKPETKQPFRVGGKALLAVYCINLMQHKGSHPRWPGRNRVG